MSPYEHGEVYVLNDGGEVDLDLGNYERFLGTTLTKNHNLTTGKIYQSVITRERRGDYLGKTVQVIPHITDAIIEWIERVAAIPVDGTDRQPDVCIIELGGTVGDIESMVFLEALRQLEYRVGTDNFCHVHVSLAPEAGGEQKSKPTQHAVRELRAVGLPPHIIFCRSERPLDRNVMKKISQFCMVPPSHVISVHNVSNIMFVPLLLLEQHVPTLIFGQLKRTTMPVDDIPEWRNLAMSIDRAAETVRIAMVGKYTEFTDAYLSVNKSLYYAASHANRRLEIVWVDSVNLEQKMQATRPEVFEAEWKKLAAADGILVPGGFGNRGVEGMVLAAHYARKKKIPYLGICLGMQVAVIEYCRGELGLVTANSEEFDRDGTDNVIMYMPEIDPNTMGGNMRLGARTTIIARGSLAHYLYGQTVISERHRHRYEVNPKYIDRIHEAGGRFTGVDETCQRMEIFELPEEQHPFYIASQFHPEFLSRPLKPSPLFMGLVLAASKQFSRKVRHEKLPEDSSHPLHNFVWNPKAHGLSEETKVEVEAIRAKAHDGTGRDSDASSITAAAAAGGRRSFVTTPKLFIPCFLGESEGPSSSGQVASPIGPLGEHE